MTKDILYIRDNSFHYSIPERHSLRFAVFTGKESTVNTEAYLKVDSVLFNKMTEFVEKCLNWSQSSVIVNQAEIMKLMNDMKIKEIQK